jgi:hypothetical protein
MEKIYEDEDGMVTYRLQCNCLSPEDARDITVEFDDYRQGLMIESTYVRHDWRNWKQRIRDAWAILRGKEAYMDGFVFREEDLKPVGELLLKSADDWEKWKASRKGTK